jgi:hypothetical protein
LNITDVIQGSDGSTEKRKQASGLNEPWATEPFGGGTWGELTESRRAIAGRLSSFSGVQPREGFSATRTEEELAKSRQLLLERLDRLRHVGPRRGFSSARTWQQLAESGHLLSKRLELLNGPLNMK